MFLGWRLLISIIVFLALPFSVGQAAGLIDTLDIKVVADE